MKITISGMAGAGKSTVAKIVAKQLNLKHYSAGDLMRRLAKEKNMTLLELSKEAETNPEIDKKLDEKTIQLGKKEDDFIIDSRLAFHFIPDSVKVFLQVDIKEAARRIFKDMRILEKENLSLEETERNIVKRENYEKRRYQEYYNLNPYYTKNYDIVIDTTNISAQEVAARIVGFLNTIFK